MHFLFWLNIFCTVAEFNARSVSSKRETVELSNTTDSGTQIYWSALSQLMKQTDTGISPYVWATDLNENVYVFNEEDRRFQQISGLNLVYVTSGQAGVWGVDAEYRIFYRNGVTEDNTAGNEWMEINGALKQLDSGPIGIVCGINYASNVFCRTGITESNPSGTKWQRVLGKLVYISCGDYGFWGINKYHNVFFTTDVKAGRWGKIGCDSMVQIEAGPDGQVWAVNSKGELHTRLGVSESSPSGLSWQKIGNGNFISVTIGLNKVLAVAKDNTVYMGSIRPASPSSQPTKSEGEVLMNAKIKRCLKPDSLPATEGTKLIHSMICKDASAFFRILNSGAIQHVQSGLCIHLSGDTECPKKGQLGMLERDCTDSRYFFKYTGKSFQLKQSCLGPWSSRWPQNTKLTVYPYCNNIDTAYELIDITKECNLQCLEDIIESKQNSGTFEEFYKQSEAEAKSLVSGSSMFISSLKQEAPELFKDLLSTFYPIDPKVIVNLEILVNYFGMKKAKDFASLFLATAFLRREVGVNKSVESPCGGTGTSIGGSPAVDEEDAEYKLTLSPSELTSLLDDEDYKAQQAIDKEKEEDEKAGINIDDFKESSVQKLIDHVDGKYYNKFWTPESIKIAMDTCGFTEPSEIKFTPRGKGMSGIEYLEYYFSRDPKLLPEENLKFPWPLAILLHIQTTLRQCNWIWRRLENGERIVRYSKYTHDYNLKEVKCKESDWNPCSVPRIIEDGGVCGRQSTLARVTNHCLGIASGGIKQPGHAAGYTYQNSKDGYTFKIFQGINTMLNTYSEWYLVDDPRMALQKINAEYHQALPRAMNHGYQSYRNGRIALLIFSRTYDTKLRHNARDLLVEALVGNPHMMDVWMKLIHDVTGSDALPMEGQNVVKRIPQKCPRVDDSRRQKLEAIFHEHITFYNQMYLEILLRLLSPPTCCSADQPKYLNTLRTAWSNKKQRQDVRAYLFDAYLSCISKSSSIQEILSFTRNEVLSETKLPELDSFTELFSTLASIIDTNDAKEVEEQQHNLIDFFTTVCDVFPRFYVTASAWVIGPHYRVCLEAQLNILQIYIPERYESVFDIWAVLNDESAKSARTWSEYYLKGWLDGRSGDIVPLLVGVKESIDGGLVQEVEVNIARNTSTVMSSQWKSHTSSKNAVDGSTDPNVAGGSCAVTSAQTNPWFRIDLQEPKKIYGLLISNVIEKFRSNLNKFEIHIGNSLENEGVANPTCGNIHGMQRGETKAFYCDPPLVGEYITINIPGKYQVLALCEVEVYVSEFKSYRTHGVKLDIWYQIPSKDIRKLYKDPRYPDKPDHTSKLSTFNYRALGNMYGSRLSAVYQPQETGNYTFYVACTDQCEVFLRDGESGGKLQKIISLKKATKYQDWSASAEQKSLPVLLENGKLYELVATLKEYSGQDYITVAVELPSGKFLAPIPSQQLFVDTKEESVEISA